MEKNQVTSPETRSPLRLKDLRRLVARREIKWFPSEHIRLGTTNMAGVVALSKWFQEELWKVFLSAGNVSGIPLKEELLDRLITQFGPNCVVEEKEEEKECSRKGQARRDEAGQKGHPEKESEPKESDKGEPLDGKVPPLERPEESGPQSDKQTEGAKPSGGNSAGKQSPELSTENDSQQSSEPEKQGGSFLPEENKGQGTSESSPLVKRSLEDFSSLQELLKEQEAQENSASASEGKGAKPFKRAMDGGSSKPSKQPRNVYGGCFAYLEQIERSLTKSECKNARRFSRELHRLFNQADLAGVDESPRICAKRLVRALATKSGQINRARRRETQKKMVLLLTDSSGSCSAHARDTLTACYQVSKVDTRVVCINHSNGYPLVSEMWTFGNWELPSAQLHEFGCTTEELLSWWRALLQGVALDAVVAFGDWDAACVYDFLMEKTQNFVWLDSYAKRSGVILRRPKEWPLRNQPRAYITGVGNARDACKALKKI